MQSSQSTGIVLCETIFDDLEDINQFANKFYRDVAEIYDCLSRVKNRERNPSGYSLDDAPIIGLLVRIWKLLNETIRYHTENNAGILSYLSADVA